MEILGKCHKVKTKHKNKNINKLNYFMYEFVFIKIHKIMYYVLINTYTTATATNDNKKYIKSN